MSPPAKSVQVVGRVEGLAGRPAAGRRAVSGQSARSLHPVDAEQRLAAPGERADLGPDGVGAQEREALAVLGEVGGERRAVVGARG